ncbi:MAG: FAD-dependent oxidoreductase [Rubellimicrobium sp.]|nr:FAD-dependent oxidoreductase [Rubellimicrobium sp.]
MQRRTFVASLAALPLAAPALARGAGPRVTVVGAGYGGASFIRTLRRLAPEVEITVIEQTPRFHSCPFSNGVIGGLWDGDRISFEYDGLASTGTRWASGAAVGFDPATREVTLEGGEVVTGDYVLLSPGISLNFAAIDGYSPEAAEAMPHAWQAGSQTGLLRRQLVEMEDGGTVVVAIPRPPFRCPPGPYERISLIAHYLKAAKPASKIIVLDAQDGFSKQGLFEECWAALYPGLIERIPGAESGEVEAVDPATMRVSTAFDDITADVANVIPPQRAGALALDAGLDGGIGWCPVDPVSFESTLAPGVFIIGDAAIMGEMPKSGFSAAQQGSACAAALAARIAGDDPAPRKLINTCYSLAAPDWGFSVADVYAQTADGIAAIRPGGGTTPLGADADTHAAEARYANSWFDTLTSQLWG